MVDFIREGFDRKKREYRGEILFGFNILERL